MLFQNQKFHLNLIFCDHHVQNNWLTYFLLYMQIDMSHKYSSFLMAHQHIRSYPVPANNQ